MEAISAILGNTKKDCSETFGSGNIRCKTEETDGHEKGGKNAKLCRGTEKQ